MLDAATARWDLTSAYAIEAWQPSKAAIIRNAIFRSGLLKGLVSKKALVTTRAADTDGAKQAAHNATNETR